jgi:hypothetical protein
MTGLQLVLRLVAPELQQDGALLARQLEPRYAVRLWVYDTLVGHGVLSRTAVMMLFSTHTAEMAAACDKCAAQLDNPSEAVIMAVADRRFVLLPEGAKWIQLEDGTAVDALPGPTEEGVTYNFAATAVRAWRLLQKRQEHDDSRTAAQAGGDCYGAPGRGE